MTAEFTRGRAAITTAVSGNKASDTASASRLRDDGCTAASGLRASKAATASDRVPRQEPRTREPGPPDCRTATGSRPTLTEVRYNEH